MSQLLSSSKYNLVYQFFCEKPSISIPSLILDLIGIITIDPVPGITQHGQNNEKRENEKIFCEIIAESARNPKLQKMLYAQRVKTFDVVREYLDHQMEKGFFRKDTDTKAIASGFVALYDGLIANEFLGISMNDSRDFWRSTVRAIIAGIS